MFISCFIVNMKADRFTCLNWGNTVICHNALKSHKTAFIVWIYLKMTQFKSWGSWDLVSYQKWPALSSLSVFCQFSLCSAMYFSLRENTCVVWERHCLSVMATVTKGGRGLRTVNWPIDRNSDIFRFQRHRETLEDPKLASVFMGFMLQKWKIDVPVVLVTLIPGILRGWAI